MEKLRNYTLKIWRQPNTQSKGELKTYEIKNISTGSSFLEMLDLLNEELSEKGEDPVHFDHDCREGICGMCSLFINGRPHGPEEEITVCQLHMRTFADGSTINSPNSMKSATLNAFSKVMLSSSFTPSTFTSFQYSSLNF